MELTGLYDTEMVRDYLKECVGFTDAELDAIEQSGHDLNYIVAEAQILFDNKNIIIEPKECKNIIVNKHPEIFSIRKPVCAIDVDDVMHRFLWKPYIPLEDYTIVAAAGGTGKTMFCCWLAAQITKGGFIPGDTDFLSQDESRKTGIYPKADNVLYISAEEEAGELRHRFTGAGGDPSRFYIYDRSTSIGMNFTEGFSDFLLMVQSCCPKLIIIDPWQAFIGTDVDANRINQVRPAMQRLASIAKICRCSIALVSHINKKPQGENINNAVLGSSDFVNAARSALMLVKLGDQDSSDERILVHTKSNYEEEGDSLRFHISPGSYFIYDGISEINKKLLEAAARNRKTIGEMAAIQKEDRTTKRELISAIKAEAIPGKSVIVAYDEMRDKYGDAIFGGAERPGMFLRKVVPALREIGIEINSKTSSGKPKAKAYKNKHCSGFEIFQRIES